MSYTSDRDLITDLIWANKILANENILDAFGHVSARSVENPQHFLQSRARAPQLVERADILTLTLDGEVVTQTDLKPYKERILHGAIFAARPDVMAICHFHAYPLIPFAATGIEPRPVFHVAGMFHDGIPIYEDYDVSDGTLIVDRREGARLARVLGDKRALLMRNHGAVVVGANLKEAVMGSIYLTLNADALQKAMAIGEPRYLSREAARAAGETMFSPIAMDRAWECWQRRVPRDWLE